jgi:hypothetical protein
MECNLYVPVEAYLRCVQGGQGSRTSHGQSKGYIPKFPSVTEADGELRLYFPVNAKLLSHFDQRFTIQQLHV